MTEEIIIDGVNVAGCEHYCEKLNTGGGIIQSTSKQGFCLHNITGLQNADIYFRVLSFPKCREQSNCHYKQLKRLEQECDELKKACEKCKLLDIEKTNRDLLEQIEKLEQENKELKIVKEQLKKWNDENLKRQDDMQLWIDLAEEQRRKYRSALEEILESVRADCKGCTAECDCDEDCTRYKIKNKINEVLNDK